jgi:hypothetical protein
MAFITLMFLNPAEGKTCEQTSRTFSAHDLKDTVHTHLVINQYYCPGHMLCTLQTSCHLMDLSQRVRSGSTIPRFLHLERPGLNLLKHASERNSNFSQLSFQMNFEAFINHDQTLVYL